MNTKDTKPTVIEGWAISQYPGGRFLFEDHKPSKMYKRASLVIGDKAVPISDHNAAIRDLAERLEEAMEFARDISENYDCDEDAHKYKTTCRACSARAFLTRTKQPEE